MAALTTSVDLPDKRGGCGGGCQGGGYSGCRGGGGRRGGRHGGGGCCGCYGGGYGGGYGGCMGMGYGGGYGGCMGMGMGMGYGGGCYGGGMMMHGGAMMQGATQQGGEKIKTAPGEKKNKDESLLPAPATILVQLPADAKLLIDNEATTSTGSSRVFQSPVLNTGKEYHYTLKAEVIRNGKPVQAEQVVAVKAGVITPVTLTLPPAGVAQR